MSSSAPRCWPRSQTRSRGCCGTGSSTLTCAIPNVVDVVHHDAAGRVSGVHLVDYDDATLLPDIDGPATTRAAAERALEAHGGAAVENWPPGLMGAVTARFPAA